ncbi:MAG: hypothetical protein ABI859_18255 [Pseudomonadota bacterium]
MDPTDNLDGVNPVLPPLVDPAGSMRYYKAQERFPRRNPLDWLEVERAIERESASILATTPTG